MGEDWARHAACKGEPWQQFFPPRGRDAAEWPHYYHDLYVRYCKTCPVRLDCLEDGRHEYGYWGGMTPDDRKRYWRDRAKVQICEDCGRPFSAKLATHTRCIVNL